MTKYTEDAPEIDDTTEFEELIEYARKRIENPIEIKGTSIYHFSSHEPDLDALEDAIDKKLRRDEYIVPLQVTSGWMFIQELLPQHIKESELLIYREDIEEYYAYKSFIRECPEESIQKLKEEFADSTWQ